MASSTTCSYSAADSRVAAAAPRRRARALPMSNPAHDSAGVTAYARESALPNRLPASGQKAEETGDRHPRIEVGRGHPFAAGGRRKAPLGGADVWPPGQERARLADRDHLAERGIRARRQVGRQLPGPLPDQHRQPMHPLTERGLDAAAARPRSRRHARRRWRRPVSSPMPASAAPASTAGSRAD